MRSPSRAPPLRVAPGGEDARYDVLGVGVHAIDMSRALETIFGWVERREPHYVCVTGVHGVMESRRDESLRAIFAEAGLVTPDGMPLVWVAHLRGLAHVTRVYGPDLMLACCDASVGRGYRHFLYGGDEGVADLLAARLRERFGGLQVAGTYTPPFRPLTAEEDAEVLRRIADSGADIVWVGLSTPRQERWMHAHVARVVAPVMLGVGAAFDFLSGTKRQAPRWMQRSGLEWAFRLAAEPRRLAKRYLVNNPQFVWQLAREAAHTRGLRGD